jgi:hypothetical protein
MSSILHGTREQKNAAELDPAWRCFSAGAARADRSPRPHDNKKKGRPLKRPLLVKRRVCLFGLALRGRFDGLIVPRVTSVLL